MQNICVEVELYLKLVDPMIYQIFEAFQIYFSKDITVVKDMSSWWYQMYKYFFSYHSEIK